MTGADVVRGQRQPGAVGFGDVLRLHFLEQAQVARTAQDALAHIEAVADAEAVGGLLGEHHDAAHAGRAGRLGIPV